MALIHVEDHLDCRTPVEALWPQLADTSRLNRLAGMNPVELSPTEGGLARVQGRTVLDGFPVVYQELPFEWATNRWLRVRRLMENGPLRELTFGVTIDTNPQGGSTVTVSLDLHARSSLMEPMVRLISGRRIAAIREAVRQMDTGDLRAHLRAARLGPGFTRARAEFVAQPDPAREALIQALEGASDEDLARIRPFVLARQAHQDRHAMLRACLAAVDVGLLEMSWDLVCPSCQTGAGQVAHLYDLGQEAHCGYCEIGWNLSFDESVEAVFRPHPSVRKLEAAQFCSAGPSRATHVHTQRLLPAGATVNLDAPLELGTWNLFLRGGTRCQVHIHPDAPSTTTVRLGDSGDPAAVRLAPAGTLTVQSAVSDDRHVKLERLAITNEAATAHLLSLDPDFRRRFSGEVLGPGRALKVARAALIFTDLSGSTALYAKDGDAAAWRVVREHFDLLERIIHTNQGTIVKTIGDAVMAAFETEAEAIAAGADMQRAWPDFVAKVGVVDTLQLRVGVHAGPAYAVTANGNLDYFGQTVNTAARLCGQARGGEVVLGPDLLSVAHSLTGGTLRSKGLVPLKGIPAPIELFAWTSGTPLAPETPAP